MNIVQTEVQELDCVELLEPIEGFAAGTKGVAHWMTRGHWVVEINGYDEGGMTYEIIGARPEQLRVTWRRPHPLD
jgi:hypothetical protein